MSRVEQEKEGLKEKFNKIMDDEYEGSVANIRGKIDTFRERFINAFNGSNGEGKVAIPYNCVGVFGCAGGVGTSTICWELANMFAEKKYTVCLIDLNLTKPSLYTKYSNKRIDNTLKTYLAGNCELGDCIVKTKSNKLEIDFIESSPYSYNELIECDDALHYDNMREMVETLKKVYDVVIIDFTTDLMYFDLVQGALKEVTNMVGVLSDASASYFNKINVEKMITATKNVKPLYVLNNHNDTLRVEDEFDIVLPFDLNVKICDVMGKSYVEEGNSDSPELFEAFQGLYFMLLKEMGVETYEE